MKLWAISDLHVGHPKNLQALAGLPSYGEDWLIVAGDVGETEAHLDATFSILCRRFAKVLWVPGNHELWTVQEGHARGEDKYQRLVALCRRHGVSTPEDPYPVFGAHVIAPLFLLYDYSFRPADVPASRALAWAEESGLVCADEHLLHCEPHPSKVEWCAARVALTERRLDQVDPAARIVLVTHFPLNERHAQFRFIPRFSIWCGTKKTADWHRRWKVETVVFGHTHRRRTDWVDGVRFEEVSLGYPRDWHPEERVTSYLRQILPAPAGPWREPRVPQGFQPPS
jgi:predicted phosphodiesterase